MTTETLKKRNIEKQMGCMAGFFQLFDRHQILTGKRFYSAKRLHSQPAFETLPEMEITAPTLPAASKQVTAVEAASPKCPKQVAVAAETEAVTVPKSPLPLPVFGLKDETKSSWKFYRERPRLSLDSRATTDAMGGLHPKGGRRDTSDGFQHSSPGVIAKLMGHEPLPNSSDSENDKGPQLRRSASESRASRELFPSRFVADGAAHSFPLNNGMKDSDFPDLRDQPSKSLNRAWFNPPSQFSRRSFFDSGDIFPEPKQTVSIYGEIEKRLKRKGIDEPSRDLETLKHILKALQLKGLLHSKKTADRHRIFVYDESPIVVMKASRSPTSTPSPMNRRNNGTGYYTQPNAGNQGHIMRRNYCSFAAENSPPVSPARDRDARSPRAGRISSPPARNEVNNANARRSKSLVKPKPLTVDTHKKPNQTPENRRISPAESRKTTAKRCHPEPTAKNGSPMRRKSTGKIDQKVKNSSIIGEEDGSSSISESSVTTSSDTERWKNMTERCDKLLQSIGELNAADAQMQPSPVSVLDSSFYKDDSFTPSPVLTKRNLDFKDLSSELEEDVQSPIVSPIRSKCLDEPWSGDCDFEYISDILRASHYLTNDPDVFLFLERRQCLKGKNASKASRLQRRLVFDATSEILDRNKRLPPWKTVSWTDHCVAEPLLEKVWSEFQRIQLEQISTGDEDVFHFINSVLRKDLARDWIAGWGDQHVEISEGILDMERLVFKDLIGEIIQDLAALQHPR